MGSSLPSVPCSPRGAASRLALVALAALTSAACESGTTTDELAITGVVVRAEPLTRGTGCGTKPGQVYKYAAVTTRAGTELVVDAGLYDCFADAAFINLPPDEGGSYRFDIHVFAFDRGQHDAQAGAVGVALSRGEDGVPAGALGAFRALTTLAKTRCTVTQTLTVQSVASCEPLSR
ncbi:MAG TPA: hypothetical protein PLR99_09310 [Polyangiaceae bacterium]|nr:hypothetical protein [Polyangiaceae bacterium]